MTSDMYVGEFGDFPLRVVSTQKILYRSLLVLQKIDTFLRDVTFRQTAIELQCRMGENEWAMPTCRHLPE